MQINIKGHILHFNRLHLPIHQIVTKGDKANDAGVISEINHFSIFRLVKAIEMKYISQIDWVVLCQIVCNHLPLLIDDFQYKTTSIFSNLEIQITFIEQSRLSNFNLSIFQLLLQRNTKQIHRLLNNSSNFFLKSFIS